MAHESFASDIKNWKRRNLKHHVNCKLNKFGEKAIELWISQPKVTGKI